MNPKNYKLPHMNHSHKEVTDQIRQFSRDLSGKQLIEEFECHLKHSPIFFQLHILMHQNPPKPEQNGGKKN